MDSFKTRLCLEHDELSTKIEKLAIFVEGKVYPTISGSERELLYKQLKVMREYNGILQTRIDNYKD